MNKKQYIVPRSTKSKLELNVILHSISNTRMNTNAHDVSSSDVGLSGIEHDNNASGTVSFGKERGFYDSYGEEW